MSFTVKKGDGFAVHKGTSFAVPMDLFNVSLYIPPPPPPPDPCHGIDLINQQILTDWKRDYGSFSADSTALGFLESANDSNVSFYQSFCDPMHTDSYRLYVDGTAQIVFSGVANGNVRWEDGQWSASRVVSDETIDLEFRTSAPSAVKIIVEPGDSVSEVSLKESSTQGEEETVVYTEVLLNTKFDATTEDILLQEEFPLDVTDEHIGWGEGFNEYIIYPLRS